MDAFIGKYKLVSSEKFDEFLKATGVNFAMRQLAKTQNPTVDITRDGDEWTIVTTTTFKTQTLKFKVGQEFEEERLDGVKAKTTVNVDGSKLVQTQQCADGKTVVITREIDDDKLKVVCTVDDVVSTRVYKRE